MQSAAPKLTQEVQDVPIILTSGNKFGRYKKISDAQCWNMIISDGAIVDYAGYQNTFSEALVDNYKGRGIYTSVQANIMVVVIGAAIFVINDNLLVQQVATISNSTGDVFITENNNKEIVVSNGLNLYVLNYSNPNNITYKASYYVPSGTIVPDPLTQFAINFQNPGYVSFQNGRIICVQNESNNWWLSGINNAILWDLTDTQNKAYQGSLQLKPDNIQAAVPMPGAGNNLAVFGRTVMELWQDVGNALFPYQRASTFNIDYGCLNPSSIAALDSYIVWLSANEQGGVTLMVFNGGREESISTDGIDFKFSEINNPTNCTGFLFRQDGHLIYQFTFPADNLSYAYDFNTKKFFTVSDENQNYHPARNVVFFGNDYYFVSLNDGNVYTFGTQFSYLQYSESNIKMMPRIIIGETIRLPSQRPFIVMNITITVENGQPNEQLLKYLSSDYLVTQDGDFLVTQEGDYIITQPTEYTPNGQYTEAIDLSISYDGAEVFGNGVRRYMNPTGHRQTRMIFQRLGRANDFTPMFRFIGYGRFVVVGDGVAQVYL